MKIKVHLRIGKKSPIRKWKKYAFTKVQLQNGNSSKCKMKMKFQLQMEMKIQLKNENPISKLKLKTIWKLNRKVHKDNQYWKMVD